MRRIITLIYFGFIFCLVYSQKVTFYDGCYLTGIKGDEHGLVWFSGWESLRYYKDTLFHFVNRPSDTIPRIGYSDLEIDQMDKKWIVSKNGTHVYDDSGWLYYNRATSPDIPYTPFNPSIAIDKNNIKWIGTIGNGLLRFNDTAWTSFTLKDGVINDTITCIATDYDNAVWIGTPHGISVYKNNNFTNYPLNRLINCIAVDLLNVKWIVIEENELYKFDTVLSPYNQSIDSIPLKIIKDIAIDNENHLWIAGYPGAAQLIDDDWISYFKKDGYGFTDIYVDLNQNIWMIYGCIEDIGYGLIKMEPDIINQFFSGKNITDNITITQTSRNEVIICHNDNNKIFSVQVYDLKGQLLLRKTNNKEMVYINLSDYKGKICVIKIICEDQTVTKKLFI